MAYWIIVVIFSYLCFSVASLGDKLILSGFHEEDSHAGSNPAFYAFWVGMLNGLIVIIIPFTGISWPSLAVWPWIIMEAGSMIFSLYLLYSTVKLFEVSKSVSIIGALQPMFVYAFSLVLFGRQAAGAFSLTAFFLLLAGSIIISFEKEMYKTKKFIILAVLASTMFSLEYVSSKEVFLQMSFWQGLIWMRLCTFVFALTLLFGGKLRRQVFSQHKTFDKKTGVGFLVFQVIGASAGFLQNWAVALVPVSYLAIMNSLRGVQYVFLFVLAVAMSILFPHVLKTEFHRREIVQKLVAIVCIVVGLAVIVLISPIS